MYSCENIYMEVMTNEISIEVFIREHPWWVLSLVYTIFFAISPAVVFDAFLFRKMEEERRNCYRVWKDQGKALQAILRLHVFPKSL